MAGQHALLIGVSDYTDPRIPDLEGPVNDVQALRDALIKNWQFDAADIIVLLDAEATETAILNALDRLRDTTSPGENIIVYYSGHGTSAADPDLGARINLPDGTGAIVGSDFAPEKLVRQSLSQAADDGLLVGRFEIRPRLQALDLDRNVLVIFDACFSGNATRDAASAFKPALRRQLDLSTWLESPELLSTDPSPGKKISSRKTRSISDGTTEAFSYRNTVYFGAAAEDQFAVDLSMAEIEAGLVTTIDGKPHGGFTDSLLRALSTPPDTSDSLTFIQLFNRTVNNFNTWCRSCGHTPVSLPAAGTSGNQLLGRTILRPSLLLASGRAYDSSSEPELQEALVVDTVLPDGTELALRQLDLDNVRALRTVTHTTSPDLYFTQTGQQTQVYAADGQLITHLPAEMPAQELSRWVAGRQWLKRRMLRDLNREKGELQVSFRHPLNGNHVLEGDYIHFNVLSNIPASLLVLVLNTNSELSLLYPVSEPERNTLLPALHTQRIPRESEPPLRVTPPWGTDTVLFYTLPEAHTLNPVLKQLASRTPIPLNHPALIAFEQALEHDDFQYSAMTLRIVTSPAQ